MRCKPEDRRPRDTAAKFDAQEHFLHARDGGARESLTIKMHFEAAAWGVSYSNGSGVLASAAEEEFSEEVAKLRRGASGRSQ
jgi:hypothetical protein